MPLGDDIPTSLDINNQIPLSSTLPSADSQALIPMPQFSGNSWQGWVQQFIDYAAANPGLVALAGGLLLIIASESHSKSTSSRHR